MVRICPPKMRAILIESGVFFSVLRVRCGATVFYKLTA